MRSNIKRRDTLLVINLSTFLESFADFFKTLSQVSLAIKLLLIASVLLTVSGCGTESNVTVGYDVDQSGQPIPYSIRNAELPENGELKAYVRINGGERYQMTIDAEQKNVYLTIVNLTTGEHQFSIEYVYESKEYGEIFLATANIYLNLTVGHNNLAVDEDQYDIDSYDDDNDGIPNVAEFNAGTYTPPIRVPQGVDVKTSEQEIQITWDAVNDAVAYIIYWAKEPGVNKNNVNTLDGGIKHKTLAPNSIALLSSGFSQEIDYYFVITSVLADGTESSESQEIQARLHAPVVYSFEQRVGVPLSTGIESEQIVIRGVIEPIQVSINGGSYAVNGGSYQTGISKVGSGDQITIRLIASTNYSTTVEAVLSINEIKTTFSVRTKDDTTPASFTLTNQVNVPLVSERVSEVVTISGITGPTPISITGGRYAINTGNYQTSPANVNAGDKIRVKLTAAATHSSTVEATLTIGGVSAVFKLTTLSAATFQADLLPYSPNGWTDSVVVNSTEDCGLLTCLASEALYDTDTLFISASYLNQGTALAGGYTVKIYIDDIEVFSTSPLEALAASASVGDFNIDIGRYSVGTHTIKFIVDTGNHLDESNELNNEFTNTFTVTASTTPSVISVRALLSGPVVGASVDIYSVDTMSTGVPIHSTITSDDAANITQAGHFSAPSVLFADDKLYIIKVSGGLDIDSDEDGIRDTQPSFVLGSFHAVISGADMKKGNWLISILTEVAYQRMKLMLSAGYGVAPVLTKLDLLASHLLNTDLTNDGNIDHVDIYHFHLPSQKNYWKAKQEVIDTILAAIIYNHGDLFEISAVLDTRVVYRDTTAPRNHQPTDISVQGQYIYTLYNNTLFVQDMSNPAEPIDVSSLYLTQADQLEVSGNYVYTVERGLYLNSYSWDDGLFTIVDISDPFNPITASLTEIFESPVIEVMVRGNYAYLLKRSFGNPQNSSYKPSGLIVMDITDPANPLELDRLTTSHETIALTVSGDYAYLAESDGGLTVVSLQDRSNLSLVSTIKTPGAVQDIAVDGRFLYVLDRSSGLIVMDAFFPDNVFALATVDLPGVPQSIYLEGNLAYITLLPFNETPSGDSAGIAIVDMRNVLQPKMIAALDIGVGAKYFPIDFLGGYAYYARPNGAGINQLTIADISNVIDPVEVIEQFDVASYAKGIALSGNYGYVASKTAGVNVLDISDPTRLSKLETVGLPVSSDYIHINNNHLYTGSLGGGNFTILDASNAPSIFPVYTSPMSVASSLSISGIKAYSISGGYSSASLSNSLGGSVFDISNPLSPSVIGAASFHVAEMIPLYDGTYERYSGIAVGKNYAYAASGNNYISVIDTNNFSNVENIPVSNMLYFKARDIILNGNHLYVLGETGNNFYLFTLDITTPSKPVVVNDLYLSIPHTGRVLTVNGSFAYVGVGMHGVLVVDISDPLNTVIMGIMDTPAYAEMVEVKDGFLYVADGIGGVVVLREPQIPLNDMP